MPFTRRLDSIPLRRSIALFVLAAGLAAGLWLASAAGTEGAASVPHSGTGRIGGPPQAEPNVCDLPTSHSLDAGNTDVGYFGATLPVDEALTNVAGTIDRVWFHDRFAAPGTPTWKLWSPRAPASVLGFTELTFGRPYFVFSETAQTWDFAPRGPLTEPTSVELVAGDNNVVYYGGPAPAADIPSVSHIWRLDISANPQAEWGLWAPPLPASVRAFDTLDFADAYFINVTAATTWEFPPCDVEPPPPEPEPEPEPEPDAVIDLSGEWNFTISNVTSPCGPEATYFRPVTVTQERTTISLTGLGGANDPWVGEVEDHTATLGGTRPEDGGLTTAVYTLTISDDEQVLTGIETWSWTGPGGPCAPGTADVGAVRLSGP